MGVPGEDVGDVKDAGADQVLDGSAERLTSSANELWTQDSSGITYRAEEEKAFGFSAAAGDFGKGRYADVAVNSWQENVGTLDDAGVVHVLFGSVAGLTSSGSQMSSQSSREFL